MRRWLRSFWLPIGLGVLITGLALAGFVASRGKHGPERWGTPAEWFAGWATALALVVGAVGVVQQLGMAEQDRRKDALEELRQAELVVLSFTQVFQDGASWYLRFVLANNSDHVLRDVVVSLPPGDLDRPADFPTQLAALSSRQGDFRGDRPIPKERAGDLHVSYVNWLGNTWCRRLNGDPYRS
jgi:hypothetical protein